ncbi:hypothetical protein RB594_003459 [Gaeumannomyces avenae]
MPSDAPIAVVGMAYRAPGIGRKGIWDYLSEARSAWSEVPAGRFDQWAYRKPGADKSGVYRAEGAHFLPGDVYAFDAGFFNMRAEEARNSDPQHRLLLECAFEAAEDAGYGLADLAGRRVGVFVGSGLHEYSERMGDDVFATKTFTATGLAPCMLANRISYFFDISGPSIVLDAACASSVYAAHQACSAIRNGDCDAAFVGASALSLGPGTWLALEKTGALSTQGRSFSYDAKAAGFGRGEGGACLLIKRLDAALEAGDPIHAVIRSSACNHGGRSEGITMPNGVAHRKLLWETHQAAGLDPSDTPVVEGHGTGTAAGDPIEAGAFTAVLARDRTAENPIYVGSVKSNFGHLEGASGMLGMIKAILMVKHGVVLPTAGFESINPRIQDKEKIRVPDVPIPWPENEPRRIIVTNFGFGGSNSAIIFDQAPERSIASHNGLNGAKGANGVDGTKNAANSHTNGHANGDTKGHTNGHTDGHGNGYTNGHSNGLTNDQTNGHANDHAAVEKTSQPRLFVFSAKSEASLTAYLPSFGEYLDEAEVPDDDVFLRDLGYTLGQRRTQHAFRAFAVADSVEGLQEKLSSVKPARVRDRAIAFVFTGQGAQYEQMAAGLRRYKVFAAALDRAESHLRTMGAPWSLGEELARAAGGGSRVHEAEISQPACTAVQLALVALLRSWGVEPAAAAGHSSGEIAAAFAAGLVSFRTAVAVAYFRGLAAARLSRERGDRKGAMLALGVGPDEAAALLREHAAAAGYATVAAINSPKSVTVSGDVPAIERLHEAADAAGIFARRLKIQMAYHSKHMEDVADYYLDAIKGYCDEAQEASATEEGDDRPLFVSSVTGKVEHAVGASYWAQNLVRPVMFASAIQTLMTTPGRTKTKTGQAAAPSSLVVEIGPHAALKSPIKQTVELLEQQRRRDGGAKAQPSAPFTYLPSLVRGTEAGLALMELAGNLFVLGTPLRIGDVNQTGPHNSNVVTGVPAYAWNKSATYEMCPRATREKIFPGRPYNNLLGRILPSSGGRQRQYRQVFTLDEFPWVRDHAVAGIVVFPMTGYIACAIEAARGCLGPQPAAAFLIRDVNVGARLEINEDETVDMTTSIWPSATGPGVASSSAWDFDVSTWSASGGWVVHAQGTIVPETTEMTADTPTFRASLPIVEAGTSGLVEHDMQEAYEKSAARATRFGPTFRNTEHFFEGRGYTLLEHKLRDVHADRWEGPDPRGSPVTVDPPTLDGFLQGGGPLQVTEDGRKPAQMPNYISRFRISNNIPSTPGQRIDVVTRLLAYDVKGGRMSIGIAVFARGADGSITPVAEWESIAFRSIGSAEEDLDPAASLPSSWVFELLPRPDCLSTEELTRRMVGVGELDGDAETAQWVKFEQIAWHYIHKGLDATMDQDPAEMPHHLAQLVKWGRRYRDSAPASHQAAALSSEDVAALCGKAASADARGEMLVRVGENIVPILRGEIEPLELMLADGLLSRHYEADKINGHLSRALGRVLASFSDIEPNMRILEIGAGTGGTTLPVLEALSPAAGEPGEPAFVSYTYTDISSGFFENASAKLARWSQRITYKKLDVTQDPVAQGFELGEYDVVIAANVLHATEDMVVTMANVRKLLKPRGHVLLLEANRHAAAMLPFVMLPGWWYAKDAYRDRDEGPLMPLNVWDRLLRDSGFTGVDAHIGDGLTEAGEAPAMSVICSSRTGKWTDDRGVVVVGPFMDDEEVEFAQLVADAVVDRFGCPAEIRPFAELDPADEPCYIVIDSPRHSLMAGVDAERFEGLQTVMLRNAGILWVVPEDGPVEAASAKGLLRTIRLENEPRNFLTLERVPITADQGLPAILRMTQTLRDPEATRLHDQDFTWHRGAIHVSRMRLDRDASELLAVEQGASYRKEQRLWAGTETRALEMTMDAAGSPDSIYFRRTDVLQRPLGPEEVIVRVEAAGVSHRDLSLITGAIPWEAPGFDGAGVVERCGSDVASLQEGDRVMFLAADAEGASAFATHRQVPAWLAARVPALVEPTDAASIPLAYSLAVLALFRTAHIRAGESVLVHSAAGALGQACLALARHVGAEVFATAGTEAKRKFLHESCGLARNRIFSSRTAEFRDRVLAATGNRGVDVIVNSLGGELMAETWAVAAPLGRFVDVGKKDAFQNSYLPMGPFNRGVTYTAVDVRELGRHRPEEMKAVFAEVAALMRKRVALPIQPVTVLPISQLAAALRRIRSGEGQGKLVVTLEADDRVVAESDLQASDAQLRADATYLVTGGTRGIGLNLARWMLENGARNIVVLGRSGASGPEVQQLMKEYEERPGVAIRAPPCDVGSRESLEGALESIKDLPAVRGVIHSALLLKDSLFENATFENWQIVNNPRVDAAWYLDELLPKDMDFFIGLSSFLGDTGNAGQAIYAGTAVFYHEFAKYRSARGQHTVSIALPVVLDVGYVADNNLTDSLRNTIGATLTIQDIRALVKGAIAGPASRGMAFYPSHKAVAFSMYLDGARVRDGGPWKYFHPTLATEWLKDERRRRAKGGAAGAAGGVGGGAEAYLSGSWATAEDPLTGLTEALVSKVSAMTMMDRSEVSPDTRLAAFSLDSLVSVELRNWIRRETAVDLPLSGIMQAESLRAMATEILAQRAKGEGNKAT